MAPFYVLPGKVMKVKEISQAFCYIIPYYFLT
jgi:hypothetical protein